jgi:hypothetical protein
MKITVYITDPLSGHERKFVDMGSGLAAWLDKPAAEVQKLAEGGAHPGQPSYDLAWPGISGHVQITKPIGRARRHGQQTLVRAYALLRKFSAVVTHPENEIIVSAPESTPALTKEMPTYQQPVAPKGATAGEINDLADEARLAYTAAVDLWGQQLNAPTLQAVHHVTANLAAVTAPVYATVLQDSGRWGQVEFDPRCDDQQAVDDMGVVYQKLAHWRGQLGSTIPAKNGQGQWMSVAVAGYRGQITFKGRRISDGQLAAGIHLLQRFSQAR